MTTATLISIVPQLARGRVWCSTCGATQRVDSNGEAAGDALMDEAGL